MCLNFTEQQQRLLEKQDRLRSATIAPAHLKTGLENVKSSDAAVTAGWNPNCWISPDSAIATAAIVSIVPRVHS